MVIRAYQSRGDHHRNIALIHHRHTDKSGSAAMAGMQVVVTKNIENGNIDVDDLRKKHLLIKITSFNGNLSFNARSFLKALLEKLHNYPR
jgi:glycine cleavage system protein P-like pyridoxal-binding family